LTLSQWQKVEAVFHQALALPTEVRLEFLADACGGNTELLSEATSLLESHTRAGDFINEPALVADAEVLAHALPDANIGHLVGSYKILDRLGSGGMGDVYLADDLRLGRPVALKILPQSLLANPGNMRRFETEARAVSKLNHPNVLTIHEVGESEGCSFIATEFIDGQTLRQAIQGQKLTLADVLDISLQVASALAAAHAGRIVHRDIKPENIMRRRDGLVKVLDFGIAKATEPPFSNNDSTTQTELGVVLGTVGYMSPEQARGLPVDLRTDLWSLGVVLYEMLAGVHPFNGPTRMDTLAAILEREPPRLFGSDSPDHFQQFQRILDRSLSKNNQERYQTAEEFLRHLRELKEDVDPSLLANAATETFVARINTTTESQMASPANRLRFTAVLVVVVLGVLLIVAFVNRTRQRSANQPGTVETRLYADLTPREKIDFVQQQEEKISARMGDRPVRLNEEALLAIKRNLDDYDSRRFSGSTETGQEDLQEVYRRATPYVPVIARSFAAEKVPVMIGIYLPMIESAYRPCSVSPIGAKGMFQFLPQTARQYGVEVGEMCDVNKMAPAAARYIADRMAELGEDSQSMTLVLLSYNRGPEGVRDVLRQLRGTEDFQRNFWTLYAHRNELDDLFRNENAGYVPRFFAAAIIGENPKAFGLSTPPLSTLADN
jgi:serine/threonine protein kinase